MDLSFEPSRGEFLVGDKLTVQILLNGPELVNAAQVILRFDPLSLQAVATDFSASLMTIEAETKLSGGLLTMDRASFALVSGVAEFGKVIFKCLRAGLTDILFDESCEILRAVDQQNVLQVRNSGTFTVNSVDTLAPAPPINITMEAQMPLEQTGSNIKARLTEPTTNADGTPLLDLASTHLVADWGQGPQVVGTKDASGPTGGVQQELDFTVPVMEGQQMTVSAQAFAVDAKGNKSIPSATQTLTIDLLAPAPPDF